MKAFLLITLQVFAVIGMSQFVFADDCFVRSKWIEIKDEPSMAAKTVATSVRGERLGVISKNSTGDWLQIRISQTVGWVPKLVTMTAPLEEMMERGQSSQQDFSVVMALRGNSNETEVAEREPASAQRKKKKSSSPFGPAVKSKGPKIDLEALEKLDTFKVTESELNEFQKKGKLNTN